MRETEERVGSRIKPMRTLLIYKRLKLNNNESPKNVLQSLFVYIFLLHYFIIITFINTDTTPPLSIASPFRYDILMSLVQFFWKKILITQNIDRQPSLVRVGLYLKRNLVFFFNS